MGIEHKRQAIKNEVLILYIINFRICFTFSVL